MSKRIIWTAEERQRVWDYGVAHYDPKIGVRKRYEEAQFGSLPEDRRRPFDPAAQSAFNKYALAAVGPRQQPKAEPQEQPKAEPQQQPKAEPQEQPKAEPQQQPKTEPEPQVQPPIIRPTDRVIEEVMLNALQFPAVRQAILDIVADHYLIPGKRDEEGQVIPFLRQRSDLPKVLVAGVNARHIREISNGLKEHFNLLFWSTDRSQDELRKWCRDCDLAFAFTNNLSNAALSVIQSRALRVVKLPGAPVIGDMARQLKVAGL